jgi:hypothetical protein
MNDAKVDTRSWYFLSPVFAPYAMGCRLMRVIPVFILLFLFVCDFAQGQGISTGPVIPVDDPCGYPDTTSKTYKIAAALNWGYGYDSLLADLSRWGKSPFVQVEPLGATVQNRLIYMVTIQDTSTPALPRKRVWIHARTHPNEVQGTWVTNNIIALLLGNTQAAKTLRASCIFNIVPMYNPDGVELKRSRENANGIDIESNWGSSSPQPEVQVLRATLTGLMAQPNPIRLALNMHSDLRCLRFFVFHAAAGTTAQYALTEQDFIGLVRNHFPGGFQPWDFSVSWTGTAPNYYPESWFWYNHRDAVLALTYEDQNCATARGFDTTAQAILFGAGEYLGVLARPTDVASSGALPTDYTLEQNYPNPFNSTTTIRFSVPKSERVTVTIVNILGQVIAALFDGELSSGTHDLRWTATGLPSGTYLCALRSRDRVMTRTLVLIR